MERERLENNLPFLSIVIPAFNEGHRIGQTIDRILKYCNLRGFSFEIIVVDDGSSDNTPKIIEAIQKKEGKTKVKLLKNSRNQGKGFSVKKGVLTAKGKYILFTDADLSTPIEELEKFLFYLNRGYEVAIGSRALPESKTEVSQPWYRIILGKIFNKIVQIFIIRGIRDTQCGFKCFLRDVAKDIFQAQKIKRFGFDVEILYLAKVKGYKVKEVPVVWRNSPCSRYSLLVDTLRMIKELIKIYFYVKR